jgi:hypothetical protein
VNREWVLLDPELFAWLVRDDYEAVPGWAPDPPAAELRCDPDLVARLAQIARPIGDAKRRFVAGRPVIHHPTGRPIAVADGASWIAVRSGLPSGALPSSEPHRPELSEYGWVELDPWGIDIAFARVIDLLRGHVARAYERAEAEATA